MLKTVKVRLYPNKEQKQIIARQIGGARYVYNRALAIKNFAYKKFGKDFGKFEIINHFTKLKKRESTSWLNEIGSQVIQQSISNMELAYKNFFQGNTRYPKFKSKHHHRQSYQYPQKVKIEGNKIFLPKVGWVKMRGFRDDFVGKIKTTTVSIEAYQYYASVLIELEEIPKKTNNNPLNFVGLDVGVKLVVADSNGEKIKPLDLFKEERKLKTLQKQLSRKKKGSNNKKKAKEKVSKAHKKITDKKRDFLHKLSLQYAENQSVVVVEDLKITNMTKSAKGTKEKPGVNIKAKTGLNRSIQRQSWGLLFEMLEYKLAERGGRLIKVNPHHTSQTCPDCGHVCKENRKTQAKFFCVECGYSENADIVGAKNILVRGVRGINASLQTTI